jgi:L-ribulose-5-phosphate 3-epimerase
MKHTISVNIGSYKQYRDSAFPHLESLGVRHVELPVPAPDDVASLQRRMGEHGLSARTLLCRCDLTQDPQGMIPQLEAGRAMGVSLFFISASSRDLPKPEAYRRLRARVELASDHGITLSVETHPELAQNAGEARATLFAVNHPGLRWNLDTANLYFYNHNIDPVEQTRLGLDLIGSVHLKDTNGGYRAWWFPALGEGRVDFPGIFAVLDEAGFTGPVTLELEGIEGESLDEAGVRARVADSLRHLQGLGAFSPG